MGRMFRIITESGIDAPRQPEPATRTYQSTVSPTMRTVDIPYVEIGGPDGYVTSIPRPTVREQVRYSEPAPQPVRVEQPLPIDPRETVLSVSLHRFAEKNLRVITSDIAPEVITYHDPEHPVSGEYRLVRNQVCDQLHTGNAGVVLLSAATPVAGTTTVALNLAVAMTHGSSAKVLIVDAHAARPAVARRMGVADTPGLADVLNQSTPLAWAVQKTPVPNVHALSAGTMNTNLHRAAQADLTRLIAQLRHWFDWIVVDGGVWPESHVRDALGSCADATYLITRQSDIDRAEFTGLRSSILSTGAELRGYITTRH